VRRIRDSTRPALLLAAALIVLGAWVAGSGLMHLRALRERSTATALLRADRAIGDLTILRYRALDGLAGPLETVALGSTLWADLSASVDDCGDGPARRAFAVAERRVVAARERLDRPGSALALANPVIAGALHDLDVALDARAATADVAAVRDTERAWELTGTAGAVALILAAVLILAFRRTAQGARRLRATSVRLAGERRALRASERRLRALVEHASDAVIVLDRDRVVTFATGAVSQLLGRTPADLTGRRVSELDGPGGAAVLGELVGSADSAAGAVSADLVLLHRDGRPVHVEARVADRLADPDVGGYVVTLLDTREQRRLQRQLRVSTVRDPGTGLANRLRFGEWLDEALERAGEEPAVAAILFDLDDFGTVNDSLGPALGDRCLAACAERLRGLAGDRARLARVAGDEFALLLEDVHDAGIAERQARGLLEALAEPFSIDGEEIPLTACLGVAVAAPGAAGEDLLRGAATALSAAKRRGAGQLEIFTPAMHARAVRRLELRAALARALERDEIAVAYQPIGEAGSGATAGVEALARWQLDGTPVSPADFIPVAEATGLIVPLGMAVLERACREVAEHRRVAEADLRVSVNVSPVQLRSAGFADAVAGVLRRTGMPARRVVLELTESAIMEDVAAAQATLQALRRLGVELALDDFGTGFSSIAALADLPVQFLKLDRSFLAASGDSPTHASLVEGVVSMAHRLRMQTVVEGVETREHLDLACDSGSRFVQGYLLGRPGPLPALPRTAVA
jgi:diguanylate cyclase (GGDEF)-like protein/PAS domain S-box-containing protein